MKKIILSVAVATMALSTAAAALEDIKVNGEAKVWYETNNVDSNSFFQKDSATGDVVFKLGMTGKQGNVGFAATVYQVSAMGLEKTLVNDTRSNDNGLFGDGEMYTGEMYITIPVGANTLLKIGKQELDTPLAFTERFDATPNTFNAAVAVNNSFDNLTLVGAYLGQGSRGEVTGTALANTSVYAAGGLYNNGTFDVNVWMYNLNSDLKAYWLDAGTTLVGVDLKAYAVRMDPQGDQNTKAYALSAGVNVAGVDLFAAYSGVDGAGAVNNLVTGQETKLPTDGAYVNGYVAHGGAEAFKIKASGTLGTTGLALQFVDNSNKRKIEIANEMTEIDLIATTKIGDVGIEAIIMDQSFDDDATDMAKGGQYVRLIATVNF